MLPINEKLTKNQRKIAINSKAENSGFKNDLYELLLLNLADIRQHLIEIENVLISSSSDIMDTKTKLTIRKKLEEIYQLFDTPQTN